MKIQRTRSLILVVHDSLTQAQRTAQALEAAGFRARLANNGRQALAEARRWQPDIIVTDVLMPIMDGFALCREVRRDPTLASVPVVLYTITYVDPKDEAFALGLGATRFLVKPSDPAHLVAEIRAILATGHHANAATTLDNEQDFLEKYNERLAAKLEQKVEELEEAYRRLEQQSREQLQQAEARASLIIETAQDAFVAMDAQGMICEWNQAAETTFGWSRDEAVGQRLSEFIVPPRFRDQHERGRERFLATGDGPVLGQRLELAALHRDGHEFPVELTIWAVLVGPDYRFNAFVRDISVEKQAEAERARLTESIEQERATLQAVIASLGDGLVVTDQSGQLRYANARAGSLLGTDSLWLDGQGLDQAFATLQTRVVEPEQVGTTWQDALARLDEWPNFEFVVAGPPRQDILVQLFPVHDARGERLGTGVTLRDVTMEREWTRTKDELVSVVSHELRTPLASVLGFAELLLDREYPEAERRQFLDIIVQEGKRLTALINDFLDLQRLESGQQKISLQPADARDLAARALATAGEDPQRPIVQDLPADLPIVLVDPDRIHQVLMNLLSNARKYSPEGGEIRLSARVRESAVEIMVRDHGLGLPPEALPRLFGKFQRVDNSDRRAIAGTGLGLAIVKSIVEAHGGHVRVESAGLGQGAQFSFTLPAASPSVGRGDILIVEDDQSFAKLLETALARSGLIGVRAASAEDALEWLATTQPRAVLLDLMLPGMSGEEFLARLQEPSRRLPVVVISVKDLGFAERAALYRQGVRAIFIKGPGVAVLAAAQVAQMLDKRTPTEESAR